MAIQKVKKISWGRRRFIRSKALRNPETWIDEAAALRNKISTDSTYQLIGDVSILRVDSVTKETCVLIEVLGIPQVGLNFLDFEPKDSLICEIPESSFDVDFLTILERAQTLRQKIGHELESEFHIVLEGKNLTLHFFIQKDYIQADSRK